MNPLGSSATATGCTGSTFYDPRTAGLDLFVSNYVVFGPDKKFLFPNSPARIPVMCNRGRLLRSLLWARGDLPTGGRMPSVPQQTETETLPM